MGIHLQNRIGFIKCFDEYEKDNLKTEKEILFNEMRERLMQAHEKGE